MIILRVAEVSLPRADVSLGDAISVLGKEVQAAGFVAYVRWQPGPFQMNDIPVHRVALA